MIPSEYQRASTAQLSWTLALQALSCNGTCEDSGPTISWRKFAKFEQCQSLSSQALSKKTLLVSLLSTTSNSAKEAQPLATPSSQALSCSSSGLNGLIMGSCCDRLARLWQLAPSPKSQPRRYARTAAGMLGTEFGSLSFGSFVYHDPSCVQASLSPEVHSGSKRSMAAACVRKRPKLTVRRSPVLLELFCPDEKLGTIVVNKAIEKHSMRFEAPYFSRMCLPSPVMNPACR